MGYQYPLHRQRHRLAQIQQLDERREAASISSARWAVLSSTSHTHTNEGGRPRGHTSQLDNVTPGDRNNLAQNLDLSFMSVIARRTTIPKTLEPAIVAAQTYLLTTQPVANDPRENMYRSALAGLGLVGATLLDKEVTPQPNRSPHHCNSPWCEVETQRSTSPQHNRSPRRCNSPQHKLVKELCPRGNNTLSYYYNSCSW
jgi:hypothetical protein